LFQNKQFGYRDAAHYYYPLYERVQQEWQAGRLPLWEPEENAGMPLLGNPTAAVLYPLKIIYTLAPSYPWGARFYTITHVLLCCVGVYLLMRSWSTSRTGAALASLSYGLAAPVLFQTCNIIFLVGAAWLPFALWSVDMWLRLGRRIGLVVLAVVLCLQVLGGDPETAYVTGLCAGGYAILLASQNRRARQGDITAGRLRFPIAPLLLFLWVLVTLAAAHLLRRTPEQVGKPPTAHPLLIWGSLAVRVGWGLLACVLSLRAFRTRHGGPLPTMLVGLLLASLLAALLCGAQLLPVLEFTSQTQRAAGGGPHDVFPFSLEPVRVAEFAWPSVFGSSAQGETLWLRLLTPDHTPEIWVPSLYAGGITLWLALSVVGFRKATPAVAWLSAITILSLLAAFGKFSSPLWMARWFPACDNFFGPHDPPNSPAIRFDGALRDGDGSFYWLMSTLLPGFGSFRYPSKLLTFTCLGLAGLAGFGCDRLLAPTPGKRRGVLVLGLAGSLAFLAVLISIRTPILARFESCMPSNVGGLFGPFDREGAWRGMARSAAQASFLTLALLVFGLVAKSRPRLAASLLLGAHFIDLAIANREQVITVAQSLFDSRPEMLDRIEQAEREKPTQGGHYRVYRIPVWEPFRWREIRDSSRYEEFVRWERRTLQPKYAVPYGLEYSFTKGVAELYDYEFFFTAFDRTVQDPTLEKRIFGGRKGEKLIVYTRRGIDLWNSRYLILPYRLSNDESRGIAAFLANIESLEPAEVTGETEEEQSQRLARWGHEEDWRLVRNEAAFPRSWVVHDARIKPPIRGLNRKDRDVLMYEILHPNDIFWSDGVDAFDPRQLAWIETEDRRLIEPYLSRQTVLASESPRITRYEPQRVEIEVDLNSPGIVLLADVNYPGWKLTIDGKSSPILRANRLMRGAAVESGKHVLVYTFEPESFRLGTMATVAGLLLLAVALVACVASPISRRIDASLLGT
jgi:hypothetical protein